MPVQFLKNACSAVRFFMVQVLYVYTSREINSYHVLNFPSLCKFPEFYAFPPFFTVQPNLATRQKQMGQWRELILGYHTSQKIKTLVVHDCPLWKNSDIGRELSHQDIKRVMNDFVKR